MQLNLTLKSALIKAICIRQQSGAEQKGALVSAVHTLSAVSSLFVLLAHWAGFFEKEIPSQRWGTAE